MTGLGDRTVVSPLLGLIKRRLLKLDTPQGKVWFALPLHALRFWLLLPCTLAGGGGRCAGTLSW